MKEKKMKLFRSDNTDGYNQQQLDVLNRKWEEITAKLNLEENTDEYDFQAKKFSDAVARR